MDLYPAIDLQKGKAVRLKQGDFDDSTSYHDDPVAMIETFERAGARWVHVVDLDGAKNATTCQTELIKRMAKKSWEGANSSGGGVRSIAAMEALFECGVARVVVGSLAVEQPFLVCEALKKFGAERVCLAFDVCVEGAKDPEILMHGWQKKSQVGLWDLVDRYVGEGLKYVLCTDVARDGMLGGGNVGLYEEMRSRFPTICVLASGGVKDIEDLDVLNKAGVAGVVFGKALYENKIDLKQALERFYKTDRCA